MYQLADVFVSKYSYLQISLNKYAQYKEKEIWFASADNNDYQLIRATFAEAENFEYDSERVADYIQYMMAYTKKDVRFLDIHISNSEYNSEYEPYDYINLEEGYYAGVTAKDVYPELADAIHSVENKEKEIKKIANRMISSIKKKRNNLILKSSMKSYVTSSVIVICVALQFIVTYLSFNNANASVLVMCGALYNTFTLGLGQYYRLITYAFLHGGFLHLFFNMYALYHIGIYLESRFGHLKYALMLFTSILVGGLTQAILCGNTVCVGMSGGVYGLFIIYIALLLSSHIINLNQLMPTIIINIALNFMSTTAWAGHLGGAMAGFVFYQIIKNEDKKNYGMAAMLVIMIIMLLVKYIAYTGIEQFYMGTDQDVLRILSSLGFKNYSAKLLSGLINTYMRFKGV